MEPYADDEYCVQLASLQRMRSIAGGSLDLPQICVVGDQSSGKSALLGELTGLSFPVNAGICTKAPIVVECKSEHDTVNVDDTYELMQVDGTYQAVDPEKLAGEITNLQSQILARDGVKISQFEIRVRVSGPKRVDLIVVDLPGIINQGDGEAETKKLIRKYIEKKQTLVLLVSEAKQEDELCTAIGLTKQVDDTGHRTLRIFTKCDTFDSDEARRRTIQRVISPTSNEHPLHAHAVICRVHGCGQYDADAEMVILSEMGLPSECTGMTALKSRLPPLFAELIRTNLPDLKAKIEWIIKENLAELSEIGEEPRCREAMLRECHDALKKYFVRELQEPVSDLMTRFQQEIHSTKGRLNKDWTDANFRPNVFECPFFQGAEALGICMEGITQWWLPILDTYCADLEKMARAHVKACLVQHAVGVPKLLLATIAVEWESKCNTLFVHLKKFFANRLKKEVPFGTMNHYLTSKFKAEEVLPQELMIDVVRSIQQNTSICTEIVTEANWVLIARQTMPYCWKPGLLDHNTSNMAAENYVVFSQLESYRGDDGLFELKLTWPQDPSLGYQHWKQQSNPVLSDDVEGYQCITCAYASQSWSGLKFKNEHALLTGSGGSAHYYYAVGVFQAYTGSSERGSASTAGIPGHDECQAFPQCVELFVRRPTTSGQDIESSVLFNELTAAKERWASSFGMKSLHDQQQQRLFNAVQAV